MNWVADEISFCDRMFVTKEGGTHTMIHILLDRLWKYWCTIG